MEDLISISELKNKIFFIPSHQRGYRWREENVTALLSDFKEFLESGEQSTKVQDNDQENVRVYCLQPLAVTNMGGNIYCVEDGQQRLTTLYLLIKYLFGKTEEFYSFIFESDNDGQRKKFLEDDVDKEDYKQLSDINFYHMAWAYQTISTWFGSGDGKGWEEKFKKLLSAKQNEDSIQFIWYKISKDKARTVFRDLNYGKIRLTGSDLIKALLLSKDNGLTENQRVVISTQLDEISQTLSDDRFWFVFQHHDPIYHSDRLDFLFNLTERVSDDEYKHYPFRAFESFVAAKRKNFLYDEWLEVRNMYYNLKDFYEDPFVYHYLGYLVYLSGETSKTSFPLYDWINKYQSQTKMQFLINLKKSIKNRIALSENELETIDYSNRPRVRSILLLHNIETILLRYRTMKKHIGLQMAFEQFPFDLLHRQKWDIEHLASQTDNPLKSEIEWNEWISSTKADYEELFEGSEETNKILLLYNNYFKKAEGSRSRDVFKDLYKTIVETIDERLGSDKVIYKDGLGNLVLLDSHTNRSFHNSLYPKKRRVIIRSETYVPICTKQVFMKYYNTSSNIKMNAWTQSDYNCYLNDIKEKLSCYISH